MVSRDPFELVLRALRARSFRPETARAERIGPLLHRAHGGGAGPFRRDYFDSAARNVVLLDGLEELAGELASRGLRPVVLKGADLATRLYPTVALRPMSDVDLWVEPHEVEAAESALVARGLEPFCPEMTSGLNRRIRHARLYVEPGALFSVDLHWSLVGHGSDRRAPSPRWFREHAIPSAAGPWDVLDDTATLLYLAAHAKLQHWDERLPLLWLVDFHLSSHGDADWDALFAAAEAFGWTGALAAAARETTARLDVALPLPLESFAEAAPSGAARQVPKVRGGPERAFKELSDLDWRGRFALVASYVFPSPAYLRFRYRPRSCWLLPLLYPARWARVLSSALALATKRLRMVRS